MQIEARNLYFYRKILNLENAGCLQYEKEEHHMDFVTVCPAYDL